MIPEFFDIQNGKVVLNHNTLSIPEFKAIIDAYSDPIPAFNYLHYKYHPKSTYHNIPEEEKEEVLLHDFPGEYTLEDPEMIAAIQKMEMLTLTPTYRYYLDSKILMEKLGKFGRTNAISAGRDGNLSALTSQLKGTGKTIMEFKQLEKIAKEEIDEMMGGRNRGNKKTAYDQE